MPDMEMCHGTDCPLRDRCYRYTAEPSFRQSYFSTPPIKDGECEWFSRIYGSLRERGGGKDPTR